MLYLASSSSSRAKLLSKFGFNFSQLQPNFKEDEIPKSLKPELYVQRVLESKEGQFFASELFKGLNFNPSQDSLIFADSIVCLENEILTKAHDDNEALAMLRKQSGKEIAIISVLSIYSHKQIKALSKTSLVLSEFDEQDLKAYIKSKAYKDKAGAVMCEGFHQKYIIKRQGNLQTALGLDISVLKAYL